MPVKSSRTAAGADVSDAGGGRAAQRRRTRKAIVDAATALLARGRTPSVAEVAAAADVSRRTVYLYFPTFDQLLLDATVGALSEAAVERAIAAATSADAIEDRVERLVRALHHVPPRVERLGRALIRLTVEGDGNGRPSPKRGYRRIEWIERVLAPWRDQLGEARWRRLVGAIAMVIGWEALIVQRDVCGLTAAEGEALSVWAARTLVDAALMDAGGAVPSPRARRPRPRRKTG